MNTEPFRDQVDRDSFNHEAYEPEVLGLRLSRGYAQITIGLEDRSYGGPEEGGWWYDTFEGQRVMTCRRSRLPVLERRVRAVLAHWNEGRRPTSSVLSEGIWTYRDGVVKHDPQTRPYYC